MGCLVPLVNPTAREKGARSGGHTPIYATVVMSVRSETLTFFFYINLLSIVTVFIFGEKTLILD